MDVFLKECYLQKVFHFEVLKALRDHSELVSKGQDVLLVNETSYDGQKILISKLVCEAEQNGNKIEYKIGMLSEEDAKDIKPFIDAGWDENKLFHCQISKYDDKGSENKMISIAIYIQEHSTPADQNEGGNGAQLPGGG